MIKKTITLAVVLVMLITGHCIAYDRQAYPLDRLVNMGAEMFYLKLQERLLPGGYVWEELQKEDNCRYVGKATVDNSSCGIVLLSSNSGYLKNMQISFYGTDAHAASYVYSTAMEMMGISKQETARLITDATRDSYNTAYGLVPLLGGQRAITVQLNHNSSSGINRITVSIFDD